MLNASALLHKAQSDLAPYADAKGLLIAVSGGPDSMALLRLMVDWAQAPNRPRLLAATVDHALRDASLEEAKRVARWCAALNIEHTILTWEGAKPTSRIQEMARAARYDLLIAHAQQRDCDVLMSAHHGDDQAETVLFRLLRGSGIGGLAGMAPEMMRANIRHARPLLSWSKQELITLCHELGQDFILDPSNENQKFARTRLRALLPDLAQEGLESAGFARLAQRARRAEAALDQMAQARFAHLHTIDPSGHVTFDGLSWLDEPEEIRIRLIGLALIRTKGSSPKPDPIARLEQIEGLAKLLAQSLSRGEAARQTLGGCLISCTSAKRLQFEPESPRRSR